MVQSALNGEVDKGERAKDEMLGVEVGVDVGGVGEEVLMGEERWGEKGG
ncbi:hypothetical protein [Bacillus mycoides]|nr:hypothetical protein [Bacillus mycoides]